MELKRVKSDRLERIICRFVMGLFVYQAILGCSNDARVEAASMEGDFLSLGLSLSPSSSSTPAQSPAMTKIMNDDVSGEFAQTESLIGYLSGALEQFGQREQLEAGKPDTISAWLTKQAAAGKLAGSNAVLEQIAGELNYIYANHWTQFQPLVQQIVTERPANLGPNDLAYRCERVEQLKNLVQMGSVSPLYRMALDVFSHELYTHCLRRKLALIKGRRLRPSPIVRQFVDLYLDLPVNMESHLDKAQVAGEFRQQALHQIQAGHALRFNLQEAIARHGNLAASSRLVLDAESGLSVGGQSDADAKRLVDRLKVDCARYVGELASVWSTFDDLTSFLSSSMNDLVSFNAQIKLMVPELAYASLCSQLASSV